MQNPTAEFDSKIFHAQIPEIGGRVRVARQARGLTQGELADLINISPKSVSAIEVGRVEASISQVIAISKALREPIGFFVGEEQSTLDSQMQHLLVELQNTTKLLKHFTPKS